MEVTWSHLHSIPIPSGANLAPHSQPSSRSRFLLHSGPIDRDSDPSLSKSDASPALTVGKAEHEAVELGLVEETGEPQQSHGLSMNSEPNGSEMQSVLSM